MIQSQGWMLVCDRNGAFVQRRSANAGDIFPATARESEVVNLVDAVGAEAAHALRNTMSKTAMGAHSVLTPRLRAGRALLDAVVHRTSDEIIIEFEPAGRDDPPSPVDMARLILDRLSSIDSPEKPQKLLAVTAQLLSAGLHFDRVVIAQLEGSFHAEHGLTCCHGARTDRAMRRLMADHFDKSRTIYDVDAAANALLSGSLNDAPLDLSRALLRGVSGAERACLHELGAKACLLLPITVDGALWGIVPCLNCAAALPSLESRAIAELVVEFLSLHLRIALTSPPRSTGARSLAPAIAWQAADARRRAKNHDHERLIALD
jgi:light-regulated signal transduction histidine kinase (bacteriophytochrome)